KQIKIYLDAIGQLESLRVKVEADLASTNADIQKLLRKYGGVADANGVVTKAPTFATGAEGELQRSEYLKRYGQLQRTQAKLGGLDGTGGQIGKINDQVDTYQASAATLQGQADARSYQNNQSLGEVYKSAVYGFTTKFGTNDPWQTQVGDVFNSTFNGMSSSFSRFVENLTSGSQRGKHVLRDFASSVVQSALQIASNKIATTLLGYGMTALGSLLGPSLSDQAATNVASGAAGLYDGGLINGHGMIVQKFAGGGMVPGVEIGRDYVPALLAPGEGVLNQRAVSMIGPDMVSAMNAGAIRRGRAVAPMAQNQKQGNVNVYVVDKSTQPTLGPHDVVAAIGNDILVGGPTKKLIHQVALGNI
ncbi:MAG TPA: phage tail tape measure C-terminal domain-containing protein, partial [Rhodopila sp.]|nr:phage tail tape measure C-terminal domain-containing protein [Rhodopila sp.]